MLTRPHEYLASVFLPLLAALRHSRARGDASRPQAPSRWRPAARPERRGQHGADHPLTADQPDFLRLPNMAAGQTPVRVGVILPFTNGSPRPAAWPPAMLKAAELALFDAGNPNILLMTADEGEHGDSCRDGARSLLAQGAEVIVGPLFGPSVTAVAPIARDRGVPVLASPPRNVAGNGVYLLSFLPRMKCAGW